MKKQITQFMPLPTAIKTIQAIRRPKYGITETKKAELDTLTNEVLNAQIEVEQYQAIVNALTEKSANFQNYLNVAEDRRTQAMNNKNMVDQLIQNALDLQSNSNTAFNDMVLADSKTKILAQKIKMLIDKLIYSAELIDKLAIMITRQKALNPLISDDLVSRVASAGKDANNAVSLTLIALNSTFASEASNMESEAATALEYEQSMTLYMLVTGTNSDGTKSSSYSKSLKALLYKAYKKAKQDFDEIQSALSITTNQLNDATIALSDAQIKLQSLQAGLAAGNAAALAS